MDLYPVEYNIYRVKNYLYKLAAHGPRINGRWDELQSIKFKDGTLFEIGTILKFEEEDKEVVRIELPIGRGGPIIYLEPIPTWKVLHQSCKHQEGDKCRAESFREIYYCTKRQCPL